MSKAFTKESESEDDEDLPDDAPALPRGAKNYMTPAGHKRLQAEQRHLIRDERPKIVDIVSWAAGNGEITIRIVGVDEARLELGEISWISPVARALLKAYEGDVVKVQTPNGVDELEVIKIAYLGDTED